MNTNGAGDAFTAGLVYAHINGMCVEETARFAMVCSDFAIRHKDTVSPEINENDAVNNWKSINEQLNA